MKNPQRLYGLRTFAHIPPGKDGAWPEEFEHCQHCSGNRGPAYAFVGWVVGSDAAKNVVSRVFDIHFLHKECGMKIYPDAVNIEPFRMGENKVLFPKTKPT